MSETFTAALRGDFDAANQVHDVIKHLHRDLFIESSPIPAKYALHKMGMIDKGIRLPLVWLAEQHHATIDNALVRANLL
jgi:4-hydroxy-tetrahydrodipicolinate synthase